MPQGKHASRTEVINRNTLSSLLIDAGFNVFLPVFDEGIDLIAHREDDGRLHLVQLKSRFTLARKYVGRGIDVAFPHAGQWYLINHDAALDWPETQALQATQSWVSAGTYHCARLPAGLAARCSAYRVPARLSPVTGLTAPPN